MGSICVQRCEGENGCWVYVGVRQKQFVIQTNLDEAVVVVDAISCVRKWVTDVPFRLGYVSGLSVKIY